MRIDRPPDRLGRPPNYRWITLKFPDSISFFTNEIGSEKSIKSLPQTSNSLAGARMCPNPTT